MSRLKKKRGGIGITIRGYEKKGMLVVQAGNVAAIGGRIPSETGQKQSRIKLPRNLSRQKYVTARGRTVYYYFAQFLDADGRNKKIALGTNYKVARDQLLDVLAENQKRRDYSGREITLAEWTPVYLELVSHKASADRDRQSVRHLVGFFGDDALSDIRSTSSIRYRNHRMSQGVIRAGKERQARVKPTTINREISCLRHMLNLAVADGRLKKGDLPSFGLESEEPFTRRRVLSDDEYAAYLSNSPAWYRKVAITAYETGMSRKDLLMLTWDKVDRRKGVIRGRRLKTSVWQVVPITNAVETVLQELTGEQKGQTNLANRVLTRDGQPIGQNMVRDAHDKATRLSRISDFHFHDFRHTAKTRWRKMGIPVEISMRAAGQKSVTMHYRYVDLTEDDVAEAFKGL